MKRELSIVAVSVLFLLIVCIHGSAQETFKFMPPSSSEEEYGTWVNEKYTGTHIPQKFVEYNWGYGETYDLISDKNPSQKYTFFLVDKWTDVDGYIWYKEFCQFFGGRRCCCLIRISQDGKVREEVVGNIDFPTKIDPSSSKYSIYYRQ